MARSIEILIYGDESKIGTALLRASVSAARALGLDVRETQRYKGGAEWLCLWGVGHEERNRNRHAQIVQGGHVACWDLGYIGSGKEPGVSYLRVSIDYNHPWRDMDRTPSGPARLNVHGVKLRDDYDPEGPVLVIGMGPKSREHLGLNDWEITQLQQAKARLSA